MMARFIPSLSALVAFEAAVTHRNFTRAGESLGLTQSGISRQVSALEKQLGVKMFERIGPRLILTDEGSSYAQAVTETLNRLEEASIDLVRGGSSRDALKIGVQDSFGGQWLVARIKRFVAAHPNAGFTMVPVTSDTAFRDQEVDVAVLRGIGAWHDAHAHHLLDEQVCVVASPELIPSGEQLAPSDYHRFPLIQNAHRPDSWLRWLEAKGLSRQDTISGPRFSQTTMVIEAARTGLGLAVVPTVMIEDKLADGSLHMPLGGPIPSGQSYSVVYPLALGKSKAVLQFHDWVLAEARQAKQKASA
ncbi:MAG: LysR family transcriptional regulator [Devosiaceae bacterium]|nr:LysR family transcriptional regulator [Devosiaceae bacterium MH13]